MIDTGASISFTSQQVVDKLRANTQLQHTNIKTYERKLIVSLGDGSTANASEGVDIQMNFATDDLTAQCAILPSLPNGIDLILGNDFLSKFDILIRPARAECSWFSEKQNKHLCIHGCSTIMPVHSAPKRDNTYPDGRANQLRHHILTLGTNSDADSDIEIVDSVELGKRLRLMREKAQNKRMNNPALTQREALHDEVAYVLTTATLLKEVQAAVQADKDKRWQPSSSKRHKNSFRKCENSDCSAAAINLPCRRHPDRLMMACSTQCHKVAKQRRRRTLGELASMKPRSDTDKADAEVEALTKSADYSLARSKHMHKQSMPDGILAGHSDGQKANSYTSDTEDMTGAHHPPGIIAPIAKRKIDFDLSHGSKVMSEDSAGNISSTQIDTKISTLRDSMLCTAVLSEEYPAATTKSGNNFEKDGNNSSRKPRTVSKAAHGRLKNSQAVTKENLCASSKRKLEAYRARDLEPQEGALANKNNEMFETILQSKLPEKLIDETHASQVTWINKTLKKDYLCLKPMDGYRDMPIEEMVRIEDKVDLSNCPIPNRSYKIPRALLPSLEKFIVEMKNAGWIEDSTSEFCSPVLIIPKGAPHENKGYRFVVDLRQLNARTKSLQYMVPELGEMWAKLRNAKFISKLDLRHGFWQMGLHPESRHKTSFSCEYGTFQYRVLPMGLLTASAAFQRWVEGCLKKHNLLWQRVNIGDTSEGTYLDQDNQRCKGWAACYMDDLIVFSNSAEDHQKHLTVLLEILSIEKIHLSVEKCAWFCQYVRFLGCIVGNNELAMDPKKVRAIITMPCPKAQEEIRVFLGLTGFYRKHIDGYARIVTPLTDLLKKGVNVIKEWTPEHTEAVETLKKAITQYPILRQFDPQRRIFLCTDASAFAIGGVLWQRYGEDPLPVAYVSRRLNKHELNYSVQELECLAIVYSVKKFRHYLLGSPFEIKVMSDHQSLQYLKKGREAGGRIARWAMALSEYNYQIEYLPGKSNLLGDALSRLVAIETEHIADGTRPRQTAELASLFPEVHSEIAWQASQGLLELDCSNSENNANETNHFSDRDIDFTEFGYDRYEAQHESILYYQANVQQSFIDITKEHYKLCPDFASIYKQLTPDTDFDLDARLQKDLTAQMHKQSAMRTDKQKIPKGKLIVTEAQAKKAIATEKYLLRKALLYHTNHTGEELVCVPDDSLQHGMPTLRNKLMSEVHEGFTAMHLGSNRSEYEIRRHAYWPRIRKDIHAYLAACAKCQQNKINRRAPQGLLQSLAVPRRPGTHYAMDFVTHLPFSSRQEFDALLVIVDRFSKRVWLIPTWGTATAEVTAMLFLKHIIYENGIALEIVSDRDSKFTSKFWTAFHTHLGTALKLSSSRHQATDGTTERMIAFVTEAMRMSITYRQNTWVKLLPKIQFSINSSPSKATGLSPYYIEKGRHAVTNLDRDNILRRGDSTDPDIEEFVAGIHNIEQEVRERMELTRQWMERDADKRRRDISTSLHPGAYAYLSTNGITLPWDKERRSKKLRQLYYGPYKILRQLSPVSFQLQLPAAARIHDVFHCSLLKPANDSQTLGLHGTPLPAATDSDEYEVEKILTRRGENDHLQYLIKWKGYPMDDCSWEPASNLKNSKRILAAFNNKHEIELQRRLL
jgi:transposase InsO family protein